MGWQVTIYMVFGTVDLGDGYTTGREWFVDAYASRAAAEARARDEEAQSALTGREELFHVVETELL